MERPDYRVGVPAKGRYTLLLNEKGALSGRKLPSFASEKSECDGQPFSFAYPLAPYGTAVFRFS
jgi:1,4-alpha-glucan branching enzyme